MKEIDKITQSLTNAKADADGMVSYQSGSFSCSAPRTFVGDLKYRPVRHNTAYMREETATSKILGYLNEHRHMLPLLIDAARRVKKNPKSVALEDLFPAILRELAVDRCSWLTRSNVLYALSILPQAWGYRL